MKRLVLVGGGHAHLFVLQRLAKSPRKDLEVVLISPGAWQYYSGMLPGWMSGYYRLEECRIDLQALAVAAGALFIPEAIVGMDADQRCVCLPDGKHLHYDLVSLDVGSETDCKWLADLNERLVPVKPLQEFLSAWPGIVNAAQHSAGYRVIVVGGGAAGVELALAACHALKPFNETTHVTLISGHMGLLPDHGAAVRQRARSVLRRAGIELIEQRGVGVEGGILLGDGLRLPADRVIAATGASAPVWLALSRLALNSHGYIAVDAHHRSHSHREVFAAGDVCSRTDVVTERSGVHAVRAGPVLAHNLLAELDGHVLREFHPPRRTLNLLACGDRYAVASWGPWSAEGKWVWRWKDMIDRRFIHRFSATEPCTAISQGEEYP